MSAFLIRILIFAIVGIAIYLGIRRIWRDWTSQFKADDEEARRVRRERDLRERDEPGVVDLKRDKDGTFRPGDDDKRR
ncbi:hypothetical protein WH87_01300 [Devosia epidermidihirudinis]|uniref:Uncharacterized protein n=1 Tax=Devosia epidermidihirudinis TaxID=1293439 RepID=A0A0F5QMF5_9HYPH|nr:hypothetical protein [Devosia epidermidihirudinis]KKC41219.1 hypothetical protein WH87_00755 [Devosia epidermidihirudinis]KKC41305.1 hypothetical protein WH87_01300 [Devosia epidermidihirudinis]